MNQILVTGEEYKKVKKQKKPKKQKEIKITDGEKKVLGIKGIVIFYAICIIILGVCIVAGSIFVKGKINETVEANMKPVVEISRNDDNNTVDIKATHIRGITTIAYKWNDGEEISIEGNNEKELSESIDLISGTNVLTVTVTEENGQSVTYKKEFVAGSIPQIQLEAVANGVKLIVTSEEKIDYIAYNWDEDEQEKIEVGQNSYEQVINTPQGEHSLYIEVVDINGNMATESRSIIGDTQPTVNVTAHIVDNKLIFRVEAEDDEEITKIEITHNNGETQVIDVNDTTYFSEIDITEGENRLLVVAYNKYGLYTEIGRIFRNNQ